MKKMMLLANPHSGKGQVKNALVDIISCFNDAGYIVTVFIPGKDDHNSIQSIAKKYGSEYDIVVAVGGDGTLSETVNGLMKCYQLPAVGYIPMGSTNDMASSLTIPKTPVAAAKSIIDGTPEPYDMGFYDNKYFTYIIAFGAFTSVTYTTPQDLKNTFGHAAYVLEAVTKLQTIKPVQTRVEYDDGVIEGKFVFGAVANSTSIAGLVKLAPEDVSLNDGIFEVLLIRKPMSITDLGQILSSILTKDFKSDKVFLLHTKNVKFTFDTPVTLTRDGENGGTYSELSVTNIPHAISIVKSREVEV
ncbi:MAG: YegS/Rv2252/BmrU family lipid kinase [Oscillospiraceae bacterium]|nr:YegS/Rv2252/BmrU family lipid kinase [Oscillospiraceae bacterium]